MDNKLRKVFVLSNQHSHNKFFDSISTLPLGKVVVEEMEGEKREKGNNDTYAKNIF